MIPLIVYGPQGSEKTRTLNKLYPGEAIHEWDGKSMLPRRVRLIETNVDFQELDTRIMSGCEVVSVDTLKKRLDRQQYASRPTGQPSKWAKTLAGFKRG